MTLMLADLPHWFVIAMAVAFGLLFGSFLNVVIYRLPRGENIAFPGSRCPACGEPIRAFDNVPVLSWIVLKGRARCCGASIAVRYPLVELCGGLLAWALVELVIFDLPEETAWYWVLATFGWNLALGLGLIATAFIDLEYMLIPDPISVGGTLLGLITAPWRPEQLSVGWVADWLLRVGGLEGSRWLGAYWEAVAGASFGFVLIWLPFEVLYGWLRGQAGMGRGDAKLTMLAGAWFGWPGAVFALLAGSVQGTLIALGVYAAKGKIEEPEAVRQERAEAMRAIEAAEGEERAALAAELLADPVGHEPEPGLSKSRLPFGPFLALGTLEYLLFGPALGAAYFWFVSW